ncbi:MAG: hypothetical protein EBZ48_02610 [Proteobacteria bacterium]|nr:hypothetical protein [Pseudomonadota bacterium]
MAALRAFFDSSEHSAFTLLEEIVNINSYTLNPEGVTAVQSRLASVLAPSGYRSNGTTVRATESS